MERDFLSSVASHCPHLYIYWMENYIIAIAAHGILPPGEPKAIDLFYKRFGYSNFLKIMVAPLYLNEDGIDEVVYFGRTSKPLEQQEIKQLEATLEKEHRTLKIFSLNELTNR